MEPQSRGVVNSNPIILFPTEVEAAPFCRLAPDSEVVISGVGMAATTATLARLQREGRLDRDRCIILAGVAGSYHDSVAVEDVVEVVEERCAELPARFCRSYRATARLTALRGVISNTVHRGVDDGGGAQIENMEGAALFAFADAMELRATELRAVSNRVGESFEAWHLTEATEALAQRLVTILKS